MTVLFNVQYFTMKEVGNKMENFPKTHAVVYGILGKAEELLTRQREKKRKEREYIEKLMEQDARESKEGGKRWLK